LWSNDLQKKKGSIPALRILDSFNDDISTSIIVSESTFYEVANALRYKPDFRNEDVQHCVSYLLQLELEVKTLDNALLKESAKIGSDGQVTFYDAVPGA
jgi:predicted nucleic acid-binding protein